jgi:glycosyltransferase involved in cell wall biosynthesis
VKDFPTLIQAFTKIRRARPIRLIILGEGTERPVLEELAKRSGFEEDISLPGFVENPYAYMARASLYILSSKYEALPTVLIEALYCGVSIVATDCPGGTREILKNGQYGQLTPVGDITALVNAIETGLNNHKPLPPRESWLPFDIDSVVDQYLDCLLGSYS